MLYFHLLFHKVIGYIENDNTESVSIDWSLQTGYLWVQFGLDLFLFGPWYVFVD